MSDNYQITFEQYFTVFGLFNRMVLWSDCLRMQSGSSTVPLFVRRSVMILQRLHNTKCCTFINHHYKLNSTGLYNGYTEIMVKRTHKCCHSMTCGVWSWNHSSYHMDRANLYIYICEHCTNFYCYYYYYYYYYWILIIIIRRTATTIIINNNMHIWCCCKPCLLPQILQPSRDEILSMLAWVNA